jgi:hypothetical protein
MKSRYMNKIKVRIVALLKVAVESTIWFILKVVSYTFFRVLRSDRAFQVSRLDCLRQS